MNLFEGLEKFGLKAKEVESLFEEEKKTTTDAETGEVKEEIPTEDSFLLDKTVKCAVCDQVFRTKMIKQGRARRMEPDLDLRPRYQYIDTLKYDVASCPHCGYTAMNRYFEHITSAQIKLIKEQVCANFKPSVVDEAATYDYETAIMRYKMALYSTIAKRGKASEKAYTCLKIAWLYRGMQEELDQSDKSLDPKRAELKQQEEAFYQEAYEGFMKAVSNEMFPMCGMDQNTVDYLLAVMAMHFKRFDVASKCVIRVLQAPTTNKKMKDRALELKDEISATIKNSKM